MNRKLMIYGAYGYTGELITKEALRLGLTPILSGRNREKLEKISEKYSLETRTFNVYNSEKFINDIDVIINCAGPFTATTPALVEACISNKTHYIDITGEVEIFKHCHEQDNRAKNAGVTLCPGAGFDVVPTDCLAALLKERMHDAIRIDLAFSFGTRPSIGTIKTSIEGAALGGVVRENHKIVNVPIAHEIRKIPFPSGSRWAASFPWGDVYTSGISTKTPHGMVFSAMPLFLIFFMRASNYARKIIAHHSVQKFLFNLAERFLSDGPSDKSLKKQNTEFWGEAINSNGQRTTITMSGPNVYALTADTAMAIALHCMTEDVPAGYHTPSMLMGNNFFSNRPRVNEYG